ncbi:hypothetical protein B0A49_13515, partial [Cryomyces minteri]
MSAAGIHYRDLTDDDARPVPQSDPAGTAGIRQVSRSLFHKPTDSHALAVEARKVMPVAAQSHGEEEVKDLGWNEPPSKIPGPLIKGLPNEELWVLIRRFNKQMYHVKEYPYPVPGNLDLNIADEEEFSPDKLRSNIERLYMTVIIGLMGFGKHLMRLRSWRETQRTAWFCTAYFVAWIFDFIVPLIAVTMITLIAYPP